MTDHAQKPQDIALVVDRDDERLLSQLQEMLLNDPVVKDLGLPVSKAAAAKKAFRRGLKALLEEGVRSQAGGPQLKAIEKDLGTLAGMVAELENRVDRLEVEGPKTAATKPPVERVKRPEGPEVDYDDRGRIVKPDAWERWSPNEAFSASQADLHEYYERHGWQRVWGQSGPDRLVFYWCNDPEEQSLEPWPRVGPGGGGVVVQKTPWGPCHLVARNWEPVAGGPAQKPALAASGKAAVMS